MINAVAHIATIAAYERKESHGGGFVGVILNRVTKERHQSERFETLQEATFWAKNAAWTGYGSKAGYALASLRRRGEYQANVWVGTEAYNEVVRAA